MTHEKLSYIIKRFYPYFWHKFGFPVENDTESECIELVKNLRKAVWVHRIVTFWHWYPFLEKHLISMISSPNNYVSCIVFMVATTIQTLPNRLESFLTTCSLVTAVAAYVYDKGYVEFLEYSPTILTVLLERFYAKKSGTFQIWNHLQEYFTTNNYSKAYEIVEEKTEGNPFADAIYNRHFIREIHFHIKSNISVSKHAEVHCQTEEVMTRFINQTYLKGICKRSKSTQTGQSLQENLIQDCQSTAEQNPDDCSMKWTASIPSERQSVKDINKPSIIDSDGISGGKKIEVIVSNRSASFQSQLFQPRKQSLQQVNESKILDSKNSASKETNTEAIASNRCASFQPALLQPEKRLLQEVNKSEILGSQDSDSRGQNIEVIVSNQSQSFQWLQEDVKQLTDSKHQQNNFVEGTENYLKILSSQLEKRTLQDKDNQPMSEETLIKKEDAEFINEKQNSPWKLDKGLHKNVKKRRRPQSEKPANGDISTNSNHIPFFQLEKNLEGLEMKKGAEIKRNKGIYAEEIGVFSSKIPPPQLAEKSVQNTEKPTMSGKGQSITAKDIEDGNLELISFSYSKSPPPPSGEEPRTFDSEQSNNRHEVIDSNRISLSELEQTNTVGVSEIPRSISADDDMDLITPTYSKEQIFQTLEESKRNFSGTRYCMRDDTESIVSESSLSEMEQSFPEDLASEQSTPVMPNGGNDLKLIAFSDSEEETLQDDLKQIALSDSVEETLKDNLKQITLSESEEETLHNDLKQTAMSESDKKALHDGLNKLSASDNEQGILDKSSSAICLSGVQTENRIEGNCSDSIQHDETGASNRNSTPRIKRRKKKAKPKYKQPKAAAPDTALQVPSKQEALQVPSKQEALQVPSKQEALRALLFLIQKCGDSLETLYALLDIPRNK